MNAAAVEAVASSGRRGSNDAGHDNTSGEQIGAQKTETRLSIHLASTCDDSSDDDTSQEQEQEVGSNCTELRGGGTDGGACGDGGNIEDAAMPTADPDVPRESSGGVPELPAWRRTADKVETARELCVGDIVRARCVRFGGIMRVMACGQGRVFERGLT